MGQLFEDQHRIESMIFGVVRTESGDIRPHSVHFSEQRLAIDSFLVDLARRVASL